MDTSQQPEPPAATEQAPPQRFELQFHGDGAEYFRIWIVNIALTFLTLGIFSAWAKVRSKRYFYGNTELAGDRFDYLANPIAILKGRLVAVAALIVYTVAQMFSQTLTVVVVLALLAAVPFLVVRAVRFKANMSAWRGIRLGFDGGYVGAIKAYVLWPLFGLVTFGFGMPYAWYKQNHFLVDHYRYGQTKARSTTSGGDFYVIALATAGFLVVGIIALMIVGVIGALASGGDDESVGVVALLIPLATLFIYVGAYVIYQALYFNTVYNNIDFSGHRIRNSVKVLEWFWIAVTNSLGLLFTLGFFYPWARVRMTRYIVDHLWVDSSGLDSFAAREEDLASAFGEEIGEAFDLGLGI